EDDDVASFIILGDAGTLDGEIESHRGSRGRLRLHSCGVQRTSFRVGVQEWLKRRRPLEAKRNARNRATKISVLLAVGHLQAVFNQPKSEGHFDWMGPEVFLVKNPICYYHHPAVSAIRQAPSAKKLKTV